VVYPIYKTIRALETPSPADDARMLRYWMVFSTVGLLDVVQNSTKRITDWIPFLGGILYGIPFYYEIKLLFILYVLGPGTSTWMRLRSRSQPTWVLVHVVTIIITHP
jgi:receptor expression-enhancing protein 5/6